MYGIRRSGLQTIFTLAMPEDAGYNLMLNTSVISDANYAVVYNSFASKDTYKEILRMLKGAGYQTIWKHKRLRILKRA